MRDFSDAPKDNVVRIDFEKNALSGQAQALSPQQKILSEKKRHLFEQWLSKGTVSVLFDARSRGVKVPAAFSKQGDLRLNFCYEFHVPDFSFNEMAVWGTLSFDAGDFFCQVPWTSVYGLQSAVLNQGAAWFDDFPSDLDQNEVLGISEESFEIFEEESAEVPPKNNVIEFDFASKKDIVK